MSYTRDWDTANIPDHSKFKSQPGYAKQVMTDLAERLADFVYGFTTGETTKGFKYLAMREIAGAAIPAQEADTVMVFNKLVDGKSELHVLDEDGNTAQITSKGRILDIMPAGVILPFGGTVAPTGYLLCDGAAVSRSTYATLFAAIGTAFGVGDGSTTFNLPAPANKVLRGAGTIALGASGGSDTHDHGAATGSHVLTADEMPTHSHGLKVGGSGSTQALVDTGGSGTDANTGSVGGGSGHTHTVSSVSNIPAALGVNHIIKT